MDAISIVWHRLIIACVSLGIAMLFMKETFRISNPRRLLSIVLIGCVVGLHWLTFYWSIQLSTASLGILCLSTTTIHVAWLEPLVMKSKFSWLEMLLSCSVVVAIYFIANDFSSDDLLALGIGLGSAFFAAMFAVFNAKFVEDDRPAAITFYEFSGAFVLLSVILLFQNDLNAALFTMTVSDFLWLLFLGTFCTSLAFLAVIKVLKILGAFTVSLSINLEPVYTIILAIFILEENKMLNANFYFGAFVILGVVVTNAMLKAPKIQKRLEKLRKNSRIGTDNQLM